jgi:hypothetical protein
MYIDSSARVRKENLSSSLGDDIIFFAFHHGTGEGDLENMNDEACCALFALFAQCSRIDTQKLREHR